MTSNRMDPGGLESGRDPLRWLLVAHVAVHLALLPSLLDPVHTLLVVVKAQWCLAGVWLVLGPGPRWGRIAVLGLMTAPVWFVAAGWVVGRATWGEFWTLAVARQWATLPLAGSVGAAAACLDGARLHASQRDGARSAPFQFTIGNLALLSTLVALVAAVFGHVVRSAATFDPRGLARWDASLGWLLVGAVLNFARVWAAFRVRRCVFFSLIVLLVNTAVNITLNAALDQPAALAAFTIFDTLLFGAVIQGSLLLIRFAGRCTLRRLG